jgi:hypothetical protein
MTGISPTPTTVKTSSPTASVSIRRQSLKSAHFGMRQSSQAVGVARIALNRDGRTSDLSALHFASHWMIDPFPDTE